MTNEKLHTIVIEGEEAETIQRALERVREAFPPLEVLSDDDLINLLVTGGLSKRGGASMTPDEYRESIKRLLARANDRELRTIYIFLLNFVQG